MTEEEREAKRKYDREYWANRSPEQRERKQSQQDKRRRDAVLAVKDYKESKGCLECGEKDPIVLELDHRDPSVKKFNVSDATRRGFSMKNIMLEVEKCDVLCANCHRRRTHKQFGWYNYEQ
jgi:hypothetical protein